VRVRLLLSIACLISAGCAFARHPLDAAAEREAKQADSVLGLWHPYRLEKLDTYLDGGTVGIQLVDWRGKHLDAALDGGMRGAPDSVLRARVLADSFWIPPRHFYLGADYPTRAGAVELPIRGPKELALLSVLDVVGLQEFGRSGRDSLLARAFRGSGAGDSVLERLNPAQLRSLRGTMLAHVRQTMDTRGYLVRLHLTARERERLARAWEHPPRGQAESK
jgi:hypothetical protein